MSGCPVGSGPVGLGQSDGTKRGSLVINQTTASMVERRPRTSPSVSTKQKNLGITIPRLSLRPSGKQKSEMPFSMRDSWLSSSGNRSTSEALSSRRVNWVVHERRPIHQQPASHAIPHSLSRDQEQACV